MKIEHIDDKTQKFIEDELELRDSSANVVVFLFYLFLIVMIKIFLVVFSCG